ncbi:hypothetical protein BDV96DRAFT_585428 [Lophiotrema nucula]|uniref:Uncharacterized protein n=1 Tax=Lophiotrema nucula TaxID=690887 RepID=A0A6A5YT86_9PLEO|nr:hypothetical protein BDV96DRAFT_585428 [Lophiotrema nucula]
MLYNQLPHATVDIRVASSPLANHRWIPNEEAGTSPFSAYSLSREQTFACIAKFESGAFNFDPVAMKGVHAVSAGNSIFVSRNLLEDPCH